jgi:hypothetical protein
LKVLAISTTLGRTLAASSEPSNGTKIFLNMLPSCEE